MRALFRRALLALALLAGASVASAQPVVPGAAPSRVPAPTNCSGTIASGGTAQLLLAANPSRSFYQIQNRSADMLAFSERSATPTVALNGVGFVLTPQATTATAGGTYTSPAGYVPSTAIFIVGATTGDAFECTAW